MVILSPYKTNKTSFVEIFTNFIYKTTEKFDILKRNLREVFIFLIILVNCNSILSTIFNGSY